MGAYIRVGFTRVEKCVTNLGAFIRGSLYTEFCGIFIFVMLLKVIKIAQMTIFLNCISSYSFALQNS